MANICDEGKKTYISKRYGKKRIFRSTQIDIEGLIPYTWYKVEIVTQEGSSQSSDKGDSEMFRTKKGNPWEPIPRGVMHMQRPLSYETPLESKCLFVVAVEFARMSFPREVVKLEEDWGNYLYSQKRPYIFVNG
jgi:hypothetical protein